MSFGRSYCAQGDTLLDSYRSNISRNNGYNSYCSSNSVNIPENYYHSYCGSNSLDIPNIPENYYNSYCGSNSLNIPDNYVRNFNNAHDNSWITQEHDNHMNYVKPNTGPCLKRRKFTTSSWEDCGNIYQYQQPDGYDGVTSTCNTHFPGPTRGGASSYPPTSSKRPHSKLDDDEVVFMSRNEIEQCSPSRKDGIDALREMHLRYSYCSFIQNLGLRLELPQTTIGSAMVLCHRFFVRQSHATHDRFLISTAALFLAAKYEETPCPLKNALRASCEILHKQDITSLSLRFPIGWLDQYQERVLESEQLILTTLNFELSVQHPYDPLTSVLDKLGLSQSVLVNLALSLVSEGLRSSLWLQFKPNQIAAGAAYLAANFLNWDLRSYCNIWEEFQTSPAILQDVAQQLVELL